MNDGGTDNKLHIKVASRNKGFSDPKPICPEKAPDLIMCFALAIGTEVATRRFEAEKKLERTFRESGSFEAWKLQVAGVKTAYHVIVSVQDLET